MIQYPIQAFCRIKPAQCESNIIKYYIEYGTEHKLIMDNQTFLFDKIFDARSTQSEVFQNVMVPLIHHSYNGINSTLFAYGQTGGGKTYTVSSMIYETCKYIMENKKESKNAYLSYLQIYSEKCYDLLNFNKQILFRNWRNIVSGNMSLKKISTLEEATNYIAKGNENKMVALTTMNAQSSRSHTICTIYFKTGSKLHLVDLAGSEQFLNLSDNYLLRNEAKKINLSLHYLEQVMIALEETNRCHIPYRNSALTSILRDSLGGNCVTAMIAVVSMDKQNISQTLATMKFAQRVLRVNNYLHDETPEPTSDPTKDTKLVMGTMKKTMQRKENKKVQKLEEKVELRDKEICVLLEMLTENELKRIKGEDYGASDTSKETLEQLEDFVQYTYIDDIFKITEEDNFVSKKFPNFTLVKDSNETIELSSSTSSKLCIQRPWQNADIKSNGENNHSNGIHNNENTNMKTIDNVKHNKSASTKQCNVPLYFDNEQSLQIAENRHIFEHYNFNTPVTNISSLKKYEPSQREQKNKNVTDELRPFDEGDGDSAANSNNERSIEDKIELHGNKGNVANGDGLFMLLDYANNENEEVVDKTVRKKGKSIKYRSTKITNPNDEKFIEATDPEVVQNIEQYLTGDDAIDEEIIKFYARRGIMVYTKSNENRNVEF